MGGHRLLDTGDRRRSVPAGRVDHGDDARPPDTGWTLLWADAVWASNHQDRSAARTPGAPTPPRTGLATAATVSCRRYAAVQLAPRRTAVLGMIRVERRAARWRPSGIRGSMGGSVRRESVQRVGGLGGGVLWPVKQCRSVLQLLVELCSSLEPLA
jgi:hypothetical protein